MKSDAQLIDEVRKQNFNLFPDDFENLQKSRMEERIQEEQSKKSHNTVILESSRPQPKRKKFTGIGASVGAGGGFLVCSCMCFNSMSSGNGYDGGSFAKGLFTWFEITIICFIIGIVIDIILAVNKNKANSYVDKRIHDEESDLDERIREIRDETERLIKIYNEMYDEEFNKKNILFADSDLAKEIIERITNSFCSSIDFASRHKSVPVIGVPFSYSIYKKHIVGNFGDYDFNQNRCKDLSNTCEERALSRTIATGVQLNIMMKYPQDESGTNIKLDIRYSEYKNDNRNEGPVVNTTITYTAPNGYFEEARDWANSKRND